MLTDQFLEQLLGFKSFFRQRLQVTVGIPNIDSLGHSGSPNAYTGKNGSSDAGGSCSKALMLNASTE